VLYILLLPLGGYRENRPNVLRYDTMMPIVVCLVFMFSASTLFLVKNLKRKKKYWHLVLLAGVLLLFTINDEARFSKNQCERAALEEISKSDSSLVRLTCNCSVLSWNVKMKPEDSDLNARLLTMWNITKSDKRYSNE
jgi:hypothetical protein